MRMLVAMVSLPIVLLVGWLGLGSVFGKSESATVETYQVAPKTFKVTLQEKGELKAANSIDIKCEVEGRSRIISLVPEGTHVKPGDLLVELASDEIQEKVQTQRIQVTNAEAGYESRKKQHEILLDQNQSNTRRAKLKLELAQLEFKKYTEGEWPQQLQDAEFRVAEAKKILDREQADLQAAHKLFEKSFITRTEFENDEFSAYKAEIDHQKAQRDLEILKEFTHVKDQQQRESDVQEAGNELDRVVKEAQAKEAESKAMVEAHQSEMELKQQQLKKLEDQMTKTKITAPAEGLVVYGDGEFRFFGGGGGDGQIKEGAEVFERQTIMQLPDTSKMKVILRIHEAKTDKIRLEQNAVITVEGINDQQYTGKITKIAVLADSQNRWLNPELKEYETEITLNEPGAGLKPGATARAEIMVDELQEVVAVPVQSVYSKGPKSYVFVGDSSTSAEPVEVTIGLASTEFVEIKNGLAAGQQVVLAVSDDLKRELPDIKGMEGMPSGGAAAQGAPSMKGGGGSGGGKRRG